MKAVCTKDKWHTSSKGNPPVNVPKLHEEVTILIECPEHRDCWIIAEYLYGIDGVKQAFNKKYFVPIDEFLDEQVEISEIKECLTKEIELV